MKKKVFIGRLTDYERRNSSYYGNPKYYGEFESENGETFRGITKTDAACAYGFLNEREAVRKVTYHTTKTGNTIIDYIEILK